ncbi:uncharacterized protein LOC125943021 [Dermacentor silvarum]|uniref:uncharacterized protein LOC125943021 n=1 Tax=Dermacentor silvarum TaxID=543639 RepID=UPI0021015039|nr:uncharacterized protein LOC125943021 [Dermacentor silvarum]
MPTVQTLLLTLTLGTCWAYEGQKCDAKHIAKRLGFNPDSWKLINRDHPKYHLMFYSNGSLPSMYKCLCTTTSNDKAGQKYLKNVKFHYSPNETTIYHGTDTVWSIKTDPYYVYDNALNATYFVRKSISKIDYTKMFSVSQVIFAYDKCIVLESELLGYQVWVRTYYLRKYKTIPYVCTFIYEACAGTNKKWVYDWSHCPKTTYKLPENTEPLPT